MRLALLVISAAVLGAAPLAASADRVAARLESEPTSAGEIHLRWAPPPVGTTEQEILVSFDGGRTFVELVRDLPGTLSEIDVRVPYAPAADLRFAVARGDGERERGWQETGEATDALQAAAGDRLEVARWETAPERYGRDAAGNVVPVLGEPCEPRAPGGVAASSADPPRARDRDSLGRFRGRRNSRPEACPPPPVAIPLRT